MPCRDDRDDPRYNMVMTDARDKRIDELEGMLCETLQMLEDLYVAQNLNLDSLKADLNKRDVRIVNFMSQHEGAEADAARKVALSKLSARERRLLGLNDAGNPVRRFGCR
jgi:hypothetical protein